MGLLGVATGYRVGKYLDGSKDVAVHQFKAGGKPQTAMSCIGPGIEINPANGENLVITRVGNSDSFVVSIGGTNQNIAPDTARGERRIYSVSSDGQTIQAVIKLKNDGTIKMNSGSEDMKGLFDDFIDAIVNIITTGSPYTHTLDASTITALNAIKTRFGTIWGE